MRGWDFAFLARLSSLRTRMMKKSAIILFLLLLLCLTCSAAETRFEISYAAAANRGPLTGRVILVISRTQSPEPRAQVSPNSTPIFGVDAEGLAAGKSVVIDGATFGHP